MASTVHVIFNKKLLHVLYLRRRSMSRGICETYGAFKARRRRDFDTQHAGQTESTRQNLYRVHLRHFLLTVGDDVERQRAGNGNKIKKPDENAVSRTKISRSFASEQKRLAVAREAAKAQRHKSAAKIQNFIRRRQLLQRDDENEKELFSTSILIALQTEKPTELLATTSTITPMDIPITSANSLPPYELVIKLLAARNLFLTPSSGFECEYIQAEMLIERRSEVIARVVSPKQFVSNLQDVSTEFLLYECSLQFTIDLNSGIKDGITSPQSVIEECNARIIVKAASSIGRNTNILGIVIIPLFLLATPLATQYSLCRWFPLEKAYPGNLTRGDVRVSVCYLMRDTISHTMVAYVNTIPTKSEENEEKLQKKDIRPVKSISTRLAKQTAAKRGLQFAEQPLRQTEKLQHQTLSLRNSLSSPIGRISRAEALSPPPSPSSVTSSEAGESVPTPDLLKFNHQVKPRGFSLERRQKQRKPIETSLPEEEQKVQMKANSPQSSGKSFLKRKPYKVVFRKLDWSGVSSKTDSKWTNGVNPIVAAKTSRCGSGALFTSQLSCGTESVAIPASNLPANSFLDPITTERLTALETAMNEYCGVTKDSASLAQFKYRTERKKFVATLQSQDKREICETIATNEAVTKLWKKLTADSSGEMYANMLRSLTEKQSASTCTDSVETISS